MTAAAIYFAEDGYRIDKPRLMGRHAAGHGFLKAVLASPGDEDRWIYFPDHAAEEGFARFRPMIRQGARVHAIGPSSLRALARPGCLFMPGPTLAEPAWQRQLVDPRAWSLCGITHTTASATAMDAIVSLLAAPIREWDALICTSTVVRETVRVLLDAHTDYLRERLGARKFIVPEMPVIPLGIDCADFVFTDQERMAARQSLGLGPDDVAVLFLGRLAFHAKAHPLPLYRALERAAGPRKAILIECGWHATKFIADAFEQGRRALAPSIGYVLLDGRKAEERRKAWAAADIFCSLSDNIQETFGLTPAEAMAAGLPVVATDWNGYRDTVRDGQDGFRIPTAMPGPGGGADLALRHALGIDTYDIYCGLTSQLVAVDEDKVAEALGRLIGDPALRRSLGESGRRRARAAFDWPVVLKSYRDLWGELARRRGAAGRGPGKKAGGKAPKRKSPVPPGWPARPDPFEAFAAYPTGRIGPKSRISRGRVTVQGLAALRRLAMVEFAKGIQPPPEVVDKILNALPPRGEITVAEIHSSLNSFDLIPVIRAIAWLGKMGAIKIIT